MANISQIKLPDNVTYDLVDKTSGYVTTDTKNTAGSSDYNTRAKLYIVGAPSQSTYTQTYSRNYIYISKDGILHGCGGIEIQQSSENEYRGVFTFDTAFTTDRIYYMPDKTGTLALLDDLPDISGKIDTAGTGLTKVGTKLNHSNSITAQTTSGIYPIKIDAQGHITEYDTAVTIPTKTSDLTNDSGFMSGMTILSYGNSTWSDFETAYTGKKVVYCRASSGSNPGSGSQTRLAFMAYVNNAETPTEVEFQYYRSIASHTASQQGDQVFVYKLNKTNGWSVTTREAKIKIAAGGDITESFANNTLTLSATAASLHAVSTADIGEPNGVAELDNNGKVPNSQLPSYVDDVLEYSSFSAFPAEGETGKIYIALDTNITYRWSGSAYVEISPSLALGETSSTAYRGDRGADAYTHAVTNKGSAFSSGMYKITTNSEGHVTAATAVAKNDITGLGIQETLVSGTNIKTINNESVLGSGNISISGGVSDVTVDGTSVVSSGVAAIDLSDYIAEDSNGDISITRNIWANGNIEADGNINCNGDISPAGDILAGGDIEDGAGNILGDKLDTAGILDIFYPVGSYYETSDTTFDPNVSWGGTWVLETGGQVHVSSGTDSGSGTTYSISGANRGTYGFSDGGSSVASVISHSHSVGTLSGSTPTLTASDSTFIYSTSALTKYDGKFSSSGGDYQYIRQKVSDNGAIGRKAPSIASGKTVTISGNTSTEGYSGVGRNMQPYIVINRWHRTA